MQAKDKSITFITPHQYKTSGGAYAIQEFSRTLADHATVNLVVEQGEIRPIPGVNIVRSPKLDPADIPDADAILLYADAANHKGFASLPDSKGEKHIYLQGLGDKTCQKNAMRNLKYRHKVIACSQFLKGVAESKGCSAKWVRYGMDYDIFFPPEEETDRGLTVSMLTHGAYWKGTEDGIKALDKVRKSVPGSRFCLFGGRPTLFKGDFRFEPDRDGVADIFRTSAVYVCSSWEEGFGMPGLECMACGTALATTDTKGSQDYALHGRTALVSPPRDWKALAENIAALLTDAGLRLKIARDGLAYVRENYKTWDQAAPAYYQALFG